MNSGAVVDKEQHKAYLTDRGLMVNKLGKGALKRHYDEMLKYYETGEIPSRFFIDQEESKNALPI